MSLVYIKLFCDYLDAIEPLGDAERGRLFTALLEYGRTGEAPQLGGNERFIFPMMRAQIDRDAAELKTKIDGISAVRSEAGKKGAEAKLSKRKQVQANVSKTSKRKQTLANEAEEKDKDKEEDEDKEEIIDANASICAEPENPPAALVVEPVVISLPLTDGSEREVTESEVLEWERLYPAVDVRQELRSMLGWIRADPKRKKTKVGVNRFINGWLSRSQDRGGSNRGGRNSGGKGGNHTMFSDLIGG